MQIGDCTLTFLGHDGFMITYDGLVIVIDPYKITPRTSKADLILITHNHHDHCSIEDIQKLSKKGTTIVCTADSQSKLTHVKDIEMHTIERGDECSFHTIKVQAVPAYNLGKKFHPKNEGWVGYVVRLGNVVIYHAGDTDFIPEMQKLTGYGKRGMTFVTLLPVSGTYVMDADAAADAAEVLSPTLAIPMHYGALIGSRDDAERFVTLCKEKDINAVILERE